MTDAAQIILLVVISVLTILLSVLGVQIFLILKDFRKTVQKANKILDNAETISNTITSPVPSFFTLAEGLKIGQIIAHFFKKKQKHEQ